MVAIEAVTEFKHIRTKLATDWEKPDRMPRFARFIRRLDASPGYSDKLRLVREWYIEFAPDGSPWREVGLDSKGEPIVAGPTEIDYGFWLDTSMRIGDFEDDPITVEEFELKWKQSGAKEIE